MRKYSYFALLSWKRAFTWYFSRTIQWSHQQILIKGLCSLQELLSCASWSLQCSPYLRLLRKLTSRHRLQRQDACKWKDHCHFSFQLSPSSCPSCRKIRLATPAWSQSQCLRRELRVSLIVCCRQQRCLWPPVWYSSWHSAEGWSWLDASGLNRREESRASHWTVTCSRSSDSVAHLCRWTIHPPL